MKDYFFLIIFFLLKDGKANVDKISELFKRKFPKAIDQDRDMRAAFEALDKDG